MGGLNLLFYYSSTAPVSGVYKSPVLVQANDYNPWGVVLRGAGQENGVSNRFEYQNKEKESTFNLNRINLGARTYNPTIGRFDRIDPLAAINEQFSTFAANDNNPISFIDPDGMDAQKPEDFTYSDGYSTLSARNSTGSVNFSGNSLFDDDKKPKSGGYGGGNPSTPYNAGSNLKSASQQNATVSQSRADNFTEVEKAMQLGVNIAWAVEGGFGLIKGGLSALKSGFKWLELLKFTSEEAKIINEANAIMKSKKLIIEAFNSGVGTELKIAGRTVIVEPQAPMSGMTLFEENAFVIGKEAFSSNSEFTKTVLHELYRLHTSTLRGKTGVQGLVSKETTAAANFAEKAATYIK